MIPTALILAADGNRRGVLAATLASPGLQVSAPAVSENLPLPDAEVVILDVDWDPLRARLLLEQRTASPRPALVVVAPQHRVDELVHWLDRGADDGLVWPLQPAELLQRVGLALTRCSGGRDAGPSIYHCGDLHIDLAERRLSREDAVLPLPADAWQVLERLVRRAGQVLTYRQLAAGATIADGTPPVEAVRRAMATLRSRVEPNPAEPRWILAEPGVGYRLAVPEGVTAA